MGGRHAVVLGAGLSGLTCARMLLDSGWSVRLCRSGLGQRRPIVLTEHSWKMLEELWQCSLASLCRHHPLSGRRVSWAPNVALADVPVTSLCLDAFALSEALEARLRYRGERNLTVEDVTGDVDQQDQAVIIDARGAAEPEACRLVCGRRTMRIWPSLPADPTLTDQSEVRAGPGFWIFLLPISRDRMSVQIATPGDTPDLREIARALSVQSGHAPSLAMIVAERAEELLASSSVTVEIAPRLGPAVNAPGCFSVGDRATKLDPICGDGTGQGTKSAILAVAAANALRTGHESNRVKQHVLARHSFAFRTHLMHCANYYETIASKAFWEGEVKSSRDGLALMEAIDKPSQDCFRLHVDTGSGQSERRVEPHLETISLSGERRS